VAKVLKRKFQIEKRMIMNEYEKRKLEREERIKKLAKEELEEYRRKKAVFESNPLHWTNNKRRRNHLPVLRGDVNKNRIKKYPRFHISGEIFSEFENAVDDAILYYINPFYFEKIL
jgi:hypothetical protein